MGGMFAYQEITLCMYLFIHWYHRIQPIYVCVFRNL